MANTITPDSRLEQIAAGEKLTPNSREEYFLEKLAEGSGGGGGGSDLPEPGTAGNVLTSTGDGWESAAPADATELRFNITVGETTTCDVAVADIVSALEDQRPILGTIGDAGTLTVKNWNPELNKVTFLYQAIDGETLTIVEFVGTSGTPDVWTYRPSYVTGLPAVSPSDNGRVLGVDDGAYTLVDSKVPLIVTGTFADGSPATVTINTPLADIYNAAENGRAVYLEYTETDSETGTVDTTRYTLHTRIKKPSSGDPNVYEYGLGFYMPYIVSTKPAVGEVMFANTLVGVVDIEVAQ